MGAPDHSLPISDCFAAISLIDVILVLRLSFPVFLNHGVKNLHPFLKADDMIFRDVSRFGAGAVIEKDTGALVERGKLRHASCALLDGPRVTHDVGTKINISG